MDEAIALDSIQAIAANFGASFDAEKIVDTVLEKDGTRYYKVRWVKFSWEPAGSFTHLEHLISEFWQQLGQNDDALHEKKQVSSEVVPLENTNSKNAVIKDLAIFKSLHTPCAIPSITLSTLSNIQPLVNNDSLATTVDTASPSMAIHHNIEQLSTAATYPVLSHITQQTQAQHIEVLQTLQQFSIPLTNNVGNVQQEILASDVSITKMQNKKKKIKNESTPLKKRRRIPGNCPICGKLFKSTTNIAAHKKLHTEDRQFVCLECGKKFRRKLHLTRHLESHAGIKAFTCDVCNSSFSSKWYMQAHKGIHTGNKPFECEICKKKFNNKANANKHKLIHDNKRPFVCNLCGRSYRQSYDLKRHMKVHREEKFLECQDCDDTFTSKAYLNRHLLSHKKKYACSHCECTFELKNQLISHCKKNNHQEPRSEVSEVESGIERKNDRAMVVDSIDQLYQAATQINQLGCESASHVMVAVAEEVSVSVVNTPTTGEGALKREEDIPAESTILQET